MTNPAIAENTGTPEATRAQNDLNELNEAVALAEASVGEKFTDADVAAPATAAETAAASTGGPAAPMTTQDRAQRSRERAKRQREMGRLEMERTYNGVMVVQRKLKINDQNVASSVTRFLALTDKTVHLLKRLGAQMMTPAQSEELMGSLQEKIDEYCAEGKQSLAASSKMLEDGKAADTEFMWITPVYVSSTLEHEFRIKSRNVLGLIDAIENWDTVMAQLSELEFNGKVTASQVDEARVRERRLFNDLNFLCYKLVMGMSRKTMPVVQPS